MAEEPEWYWRRHPNPPPITLVKAQALLAGLADRTGISRMHYAKVRASWFVRVHVNGAYTSRSFADRTYGSAEAALAAAVAWRDAQRAVLGE